VEKKSRKKLGGGGRAWHHSVVCVLTRKERGKTQVPQRKKNLEIDQARWEEQGLVIVNSLGLGWGGVLWGGWVPREEAWKKKESAREKDPKSPTRALSGKRKSMTLEICARQRGGESEEEEGGRNHSRLR